MTLSYSNSSDINYPEDDPQQQAAYWFAIIQNENCSEAQLRAFSLWLSQDQAHQDAYDECVMFYEISAELSEDEDILALRRSALGVGKTKERSVKRFAAVSIAATFLIAALFILPQIYNQQADERVQVDKIELSFSDSNNLTLVTAVGEQLTRTLNDGSMIELNTDSEIRVQLSKGQRSIYLLKGQAVFSVAHDETRPFVVFAGDRRVTALGTMFEVRLGDEAAQVTLLEGKVKVDEVSLTDEQSSVSDQPTTIELLPGDRYISDTNEMVRVEPERIESDLSWRDGRHIFVDEKISKIVSELNRYTERKIVINDPQIGELRASANFKMGSTQSLSAALKATFGLSVRTDMASNTIIVDWE